MQINSLRNDISKINMKLPFNHVLAPVLKPYLGRARMFCYHPAFSMSIHYAYIYAILGFFISANHLRKHMGELPPLNVESTCTTEQNSFMILHDLKIIATSMGMVQYLCLLVGCLSENPSLILPHLFGQMVFIMVKVLNVLLLITSLKLGICKMGSRIPPIFLLTFNWLQVFCVFNKFLCICDL